MSRILLSPHSLLFSFYEIRGTTHGKGFVNTMNYVGYYLVTVIMNVLL